MTGQFIEQLQADIAAQKTRASARIAALVPFKMGRDEELPLQAHMGTVWMRSAAGSAIEFYSWRDANYCHGPMYEAEDVAQTHATVHTLARTDRAYLKTWEDFTLYDLDMFHTLVWSLLRAGFTLWTDPPEHYSNNQQDAEKKDKVEKAGDLVIMAKGYNVTRHIDGMAALRQRGWIV